MIKTILFDNNGVLCTSNAENGYDSLEKHISVPRKVYQPIYEHLAKEGDEGKITAIQLFERFTEELKLKNDPLELKEAVYGSFVRKDKVINFAKELKTKYEIALLSNFTDEFWKLNKRWRLDEIFEKEKMFISFELKSRKPLKDIYETVLTRLGRNPEEVIFIDDVPEFVEAAESLGIKGIVFNTPEQLKNELKLILEKENVKK